MPATGASSGGRLQAALSWFHSPAGARVLILLGAVAGLLAVIGGALGSHALRQSLPPARLATIGTAVGYQMYHALALLAIGGLQHSSAANPWFARAGACMAGGIFLFCGSLWLIGLLEWRAVGTVAPVGGFLFMLGWVLVAVGALRRGG
jgi:uncharacterized membrane protein YgdD (TMEM256/DUF423 family)